MTEQEDLKAQKRMQVILDHLAGRINATQSAQELGVSRKTFYEWLERARDAVYLSQKERTGGRPPDPVDSEKEELLEELEQAKKDRLVLENRLRIQEVIRQTIEDMHNGSSLPKKKRQG